MELVNGSIPRITMKAAIKLGVLEILAKASPSQLTSSEIASQLPTNNKEAPIVLDRILRLLACHSFRNLVTNKDGSVQRLYGLASVSRFFVPNEDGVSLAPCLLLDHDPPPPLLLDHDPSLPRLLDHDPSPMIFQVMTQVRSALDKGFEELNELVDVAGGLGVNMSLIVNTYSQIRGINFDLPHVIENASSSPGVEHVGGDVFVKIPNGQAIFMKFILHDWSDEQYLKILKNCYDALPESGKVIIVESIVPESSQISIMYNLFPGAKERTMEEFNALAIGAGFGTIKVICRAYCYWVIEFYKTM
ncbi:Flavone 3'-O-methyltransferase 1 [Citrus sinensis]|nr:Flavone 3'-O-methyltransferase 1 [Citrus sinensis]